MTVPTFIPPLNPSPGSGKACKPRVLAAEFGDAYTQRTEDGLNPLRRQLTLRWDVLTTAELNAIDAFFEARAGAEAFFYTAPRESAPRKWRCPEWQPTYNEADINSLTATLVEEFDL